MNASLTLVPTPIADELPLETIAHAALLQDCLKEEIGILVEEHKIGRQRWLKWGLPREAIERFTLFNEHTQETLVPELIKSMKKGKRFFLLSDAGLPAFCDPGQKLVSACHDARLAVSSTPFPNSIALALALSGFSHQEFHFAGFLPANSEERKVALERLARIPQTLILMDTPYRLQALLEDLKSSSLKKRALFVATDLNQTSEKLYRGSMQDLQSTLAKVGKKEFVMVISVS
ncbi:MAG: hypothetical protein H7333_09475 [Bdellovibrionales bacterium]|nr:hypothetical protein [Oligoflexia bacterium]